ncbi:hypothetical protein J7I94_05090 [Streptomyces sp. ISL-12]|uniref:hypothetical protein n=1 Tax=Streptomyces sp. ISL-12 TaxID=2819177 RepID=UPI001BE62C47|nr:hypothetical protein [Streptomyces sp. ISL-12]MBT2409935.1 hypothetical protein [Streptomyces sp. ISL-12]
MSETASTATELASQYAAQVTGDLERNAKEQERLSSEITTLQEQLAALQRDHSVLVNIQQALGSTRTPAEETVAPDTAAVPSPRKKSTPAEGTGGKQTRAKKSAPQQRKAEKKAPPAGKSAAKPAARTAAKSATKSAAKKPAAPTLGELILGVLAEQTEPRSAAEVATALGEAHADRTVKTTVVRNTLENLVARNQVQRTKQGSSVFYTVSEAAPAAAPADEAPSEKAE